ncbi:hypothetical protein L1049_008488 [Liquidambar formosana]|uniref:Probable magnesium transporter n=1 Tax=Liquidambar formosana TaxID=63359 RepID=A0AAP0X4M0_LIQFO
MHWLKQVQILCHPLIQPSIFEAFAPITTYDAFNAIVAAPISAVDITVTADNNVAPTVALSDGVNDAPAIATADIGIAMGLLGSALATETGHVMSVKALGTSLKLTFEGNNQLIYPETWFFMLVVATCVITQMNYLNKGLGVRVRGLAVRGWCFVISCCTFVPCCALFTAHQVLCCASVLCSGVCR